MVRLAIGVLALVSGTAQAQETALLQAFSGNWFSFEPSLGTTEPCAFRLSVEPAPNGGLQAVSKNCVPPLDKVTLWGIIDGKIRLIGTTGQIATLGGHQLRMTGELNPTQRTIVLERASGDTNAQALSRAMATYRCLFAGYSKRCASQAQTQMPDVSPDLPQQITTLVALNIRAQPRSDSPVRQVLPPSTTTSVDACVVTSDGPWCQITGTAEGGWVARNALRQETWPVLTYTFVR